MEQRIETILSESKTVAVVGISDKPDRPMAWRSTCRSGDTA